MDSNSKIYVAGNTGLVGSAIIRMLKGKGFNNIISSPSSHWDLTVQSRVDQFFRINQPEYIVQRLKQEKSAKLRNAKIRLSNVKLDEIVQVMRGKAKWIKR